MASKLPDPAHAQMPVFAPSSGGGLIPLAPAPLLPNTNSTLQLNLPFITTTSPPMEEELTSDLHFPVRLHYMLTDIHKEGLFSHIISWQPHGRCFVVHDKKAFVEKILCLWFRQSKWASFQRQLNMYGFKRLTHGRDKNGYYHNMFIQNQPSLAAGIQRQKIKGNGHRRAAQPELEPDFYKMPSIHSMMPPQLQLDRRGVHQPTTTITLRASLATHYMSPPRAVVGPRNTIAMMESKKCPAPAAGFPSIPAHTTMSDEDEKDLEALAQLASWF